MRTAQASEISSVGAMPLSRITSLAMKEPDDGESDGDRSRIERDWVSVGANRSESRWERGFGRRADCEGIEWVAEGAVDVGGSYRAHIIYILNPLTGCLMCRPLPAMNTSANRSSARPLLVVHSGKTTIGLSALARMSSMVVVIVDVELP